jgi:hypothetical protein
MTKIDSFPPSSRRPSPRPLSPMTLPAQFTICNYQMPLAVYREVAAHLQQIEGIGVAFLEPIERKFSYLESQVGGLEIILPDRFSDRDRILLQRLLDYYADRYERWEIEDRSRNRA